MLILCNETSETRTFTELSSNELEVFLQEDRGWHECINMHDPSIMLRVFFDIDCRNSTYSSEFVRRTCIDILCQEFQCGEDDWAIASCNRENTISYHILSRIYKISLEDLRKLTFKLHDICPYFDHSILFFDLTETFEYGFCRLPNQSKHNIGKPGPPFSIEQGVIKDFFITSEEILRLETYLHKTNAY
jgi:hypothetical protein